MITMKKCGVLFLFILLFIFPHTIWAESINSFDSNILVNKDGTIDVKETIVYDFGDLYKHGIYRNIPYIKTNKDGKKYRMDVQGMSVLDEKGNWYKYEIIGSDDQLEFKIGDPNKTITGLHSYVISYKVSGALTYFSEHDELYWNCTGNEWTIPISQVTCQVTLPTGISKNEIKTACYSGHKGSAVTECEMKTNNSNFFATSKNPLSANEGLTIVIGFPKGTTVVLEPKEVIPFFQTILGKIVLLLLILLATFWYIMYPLKIVYKWFKYGRDPKGTVGETKAWFDPPKSPKSNRFLTPAEVGTLGDESADLKDITATIIDLARRGYLRIEERKKSDFFFIKTKSEDISLLPFEKKLVNGLFEAGKTIRLKDEELYETVEDVKKDLYEDVVNEGLFPKNPQSIRTFYSVIAIFALVTGNLFLAAVSFIFGRNMPAKTIEGVNAFNVSESLKNFLSSQERQLAFQADKQMMFEKLLPFAIAFGIERIWAKRFETLNLKQPDWYQGYGYTNFSTIVFMNSMNSSFSTFRNSATPTQSSSGFSSGFSGGSSGGGGGGGGGGSW